MSGVGPAGRWLRLWKVKGRRRMRSRGVRIVVGMKADSRNDYAQTLAMSLTLERYWRLTANFLLPQSRSITRR